MEKVTFQWGLGNGETIVVKEGIIVEAHSDGLGYDVKFDEFEAMPIPVEAVLEIKKAVEEIAFTVYMIEMDAKTKEETSEKIIGIETMSYAAAEARLKKSAKKMGGRLYRENGDLIIKIKPTNGKIEHIIYKNDGGIE